MVQPDLSKKPLLSILRKPILLSNAQETIPVTKEQHIITLLKKINEINFVLDEKRHKITIKKTECQLRQQLLEQINEVKKRRNLQSSQIIDRQMLLINRGQQLQQQYHNGMNLIKQRINKLMNYSIELGCSNSNGQQFRKDSTVKQQQIKQYISQKQSQIILRKHKIQQLNIIYQKTRKQQQKIQPMVDSSLSHIGIIRLQMMKNIQVGLLYTKFDLPHQQIFQYTIIKEDKLKKVSISQIISFVISSLYPKMNALLSKICYQSKIYQVLLKGIIDPKLTDQLKLKVGIPQEKDSKKTQSNKNPKNLIVLISKSNNLVNQFKAKLTQHLVGFNNQIIKVHYLQFHPLKDNIQEIRILYSLGDVEISKIIYLLTMKSPPQMQHIISIVQRKKKSNISDILDEMGEKRVYLVLDVPFTLHKSEEKAYCDAIEYLRRQK